MGLTRIDRWDVHCDGPLSEAALQRKVEALGFIVTARTYPAGTAASAPAGLREGITAVARGLVKVTVDGDETFLVAGDLAYVPPGAVVKLEDVGTSTALCLEAVSHAEAPGSSPTN